MKCNKFDIKMVKLSRIKDIRIYWTMGAEFGEYKQMHRTIKIKVQNNTLFTGLRFIVDFIHWCGRVKEAKKS